MSESNEKYSPLRNIYEKTAKYLCAPDSFYLHIDFYVGAVKYYCFAEYIYLHCRVFMCLVCFNDRDWAHNILV